MEDIAPLVFDIGTQILRAGFAGDDLPKVRVPNFLGLPIGENVTLSYALFPLNPLEKRDHVSLCPGLVYSTVNPPKQRPRYVANPEILEVLLDESVGPKGLADSIQERPVILSEPNYSDKAYRETMAELFFEKFASPCMYLGKKSALTSYACGRTSSIVLDIGASCVSVGGVNEGYVLPFALQEYPIGGEILTRLTQALLPKSLPAGFSIVDPVVEKCESSSIAEGTVELWAECEAMGKRRVIPTPHVTPDYRAFGTNHVASLLKQAVGVCLPRGTNESSSRSSSSSSSSQLSSSPFFLPDGQAVSVATVESIVSVVPQLLFSPVALVPMREKLRACHLPPRLSSLASGMRPGVGGASVDSSTRRSCTLERIRSDPSSSSPSASSSSSFEKLNAFAELCSLLELDHGAFRDAGSFDVTIDSKVGAAGTGNINTAPVALGSSLQQSSNGLPPPLRSSSIGGLTGCPEGTEAEDGPCRFPGLAEAISRCVEAAGTRGAVPVRMELLTSALVVGGGCTLFPNFFGRLQQEVRNRQCTTTEIDRLNKAI
eukprot:GHVT01076793.1.p1 GENE.GHVT01076793.1~~GHVT01076793.1.p1  ORF type:complete len:545 (+),score=45.89 GHVT01076793.1:170-1804(+)